MDWEEVRVRAAQEFHKHSDLLRYRIGMPSGAPRLRSDATPGRFFFDANEVSQRAELVRLHLPDEASGILLEANDICGHRFRLLGYQNLDYGGHDSEPKSTTTNKGIDGKKDIDWHLDLVHGKRAPLDPWFKIPFLDFSVVGDHKVTWELNRHQHLVTLAKARLLSRDEKYGRELVAQWRSWMQANPYPVGINWGSSLEVSFRSLSWIWVDRLLTEAPEYAEFRADLAPALAVHGHYIWRYLSTYFSPNTHLLGEATALFFLGTLYPQMPDASNWREAAWNILLQEAERQVRPDGVYFEQSLHYHVYALDFFLYARLLAARNGREIPAALDGVLEKMLAVIAGLAQAGPAEGFGDDDGGRVFNPRRNRTEHMTDPLALGAIMYTREFSAARLTEEALWLFGNQAVEKLAPPNRKLGSSPAHSIAFPDGGIYMLADSQPHPQALVIDAGPQGVGRSGHGHADALSLRLSMDGRRYLVDSGSGVYISKDATDRNRFRGTGAHNTLRVDGLDQAVPDEAFSWTHIPATLAESWVQGKSFTYFVGSHNGYARLADPVLHRRHVLKIAGGACLVRDVALGHAEHELEIRWHFAPDLQLHSGSRGRVTVIDPASQLAGAGWTLLVPEQTAWQSEITETLVSPTYGALEGAPLLRCHARLQLPAETATALLLGERLAEANPVLTREAGAAVQAYEIQTNDAPETFLFGLDDRSWTFSPWTSDARVLYCRMVKDKPAHLIVIGGTRVEWQGRPLLEASPSSKDPARFEWRNSEPSAHPDGGGFSATRLFDEWISASGSSAQFTGAESTVDASNYAEKS